MIGKLPDEILESIMYHLTTKDAARMSVLSQRWKRIWKTTIQITPSLTFDFDDGPLVDEEELMTKKRANNKINVVNELVELHKAPTLDEFSLFASTLDLMHHHHINTWMEFAAKKKNVKKLHLKLSEQYDATFVADNFHGLRDLYMDDIYVTENVIHRLFYNSPLLERFSLLFSSKLDKLIVSAPSLKFMRLYSLDNLQHLEISSAQNLNTIEIGAAFALQRVNISAPNLSHLVLSIHGRRFKFDPYLSLLNQVKRLTLLIEACPEEISDKFPLPQFSKVEHLELEMVLGSTIPVHHLPDVLAAVPLLNTFTFEFYKTGHPGSSNGLKWFDDYIPEKVDVNGHSCQYVKVVKLINFGGCKNEVEFLLHLLKNIVLVENIIIQLVPLSLWIKKGYWYDHEDEFDHQYEKLCVGCAQQLKTKILQVHPHANVIVTV